MDIDKTRWVFRMGDVFPSGNPLSAFVVSLSAGLNDLLFVSRLLVPPDDDHLLARELSPTENAYLLRLSVSHVWELLLLLENAESVDVIRVFLDGLSADAQEHLELLRGLRTERSDQTLRPMLAHTRNKTWHYPKPGDKHLSRALQVLAPYRGVLEMGDKMPTIRAPFADEVMVQFLTHYAEDDRKALTALLLELVGVTSAFVHLTQRVLDFYLGGLPEKSVRCYLPGEEVPDDEVPELPDDASA